MRKTIDILGVPVDSITMNEAVGKIGSFMEEGGLHTIFTPNAEIMMEAQRNPELKEILSNADMLTADGAGVVLASKLLNRRVPEKVSGFDLVQEIFKTYGSRGLKVFLFGAKPGVAEEAAKNIEAANPGLIVAGSRNGYFTPDEESDIVSEINSSNADILLVALGAPKQEKWIARNRSALKVKVCIGCGGTIDILSGRVQLSPDFFRRNGLEWLHRLYREPKRYKRMMDLPRFMIRIVWRKFTGR